jgi:hypothetical protein
MRPCHEDAAISVTLAVTQYHLAACRAFETVAFLRSSLRCFGRGLRWRYRQSLCAKAPPREPRPQAPSRRAEQEGYGLRPDRMRSGDRCSAKSSPLSNAAKTSRKVMSLAGRASSKPPPGPSRARINPAAVISENRRRTTTGLAKGARARAPAQPALPVGSLRSWLCQSSPVVY